MLVGPFTFVWHAQFKALTHYEKRPNQDDACVSRSSVISMLPFRFVWLFTIQNTYTLKEETKVLVGSSIVSMSPFPFVWLKTLTSYEKKPNKMMCVLVTSSIVSMSPIPFAWSFTIQNTYCAIIRNVTVCYMYFSLPCQVEPSAL